MSLSGRSDHVAVSFSWITCCIPSAGLCNMKWHNPARPLEHWGQLELTNVIADPLISYCMGSYAASLHTPNRGGTCCHQVMCRIQRIAGG